MRKTYKKLDKRIKRKVYLLWYNMLRRCLNVNHPDYRYYGLIGVTVCTRWENLDNFAEDIVQLDGWDYEAFSQGMLQLDKDTLGGSVYDSDNCRFVTAEENKKVKPQQQSVTIGVNPEGHIFRFTNKAQFAREHGLNGGTISDCVHGHIKKHKGWKFYKEDDYVVETLEAIERVSS